MDNLAFVLPFYVIQWLQSNTNFLTLDKFLYVFTAATYGNINTEI